VAAYGRFGGGETDASVRDEWFQAMGEAPVSMAQ
jgi:hypothetical protein